MSTYQKIFFAFGIFFISMSIFLFIIHFMSATFPSGISTTSLALAVMSLCLVYLYPKFSSQREKMKNIRYKSTAVTIVFTVLFLMFGWLMIETDIISMTTIQFIQVIIAFIISSFFICMVIFSRIT